MPATQARIAGLARTPDGRGLAVQRADGGEVYSLNGESLEINHRWIGVRNVVVLNKGQKLFEGRTALMLNDSQGEPTFYMWINHRD